MNEPYDGAGDDDYEYQYAREFLERIWMSKQILTDKDGVEFEALETGIEKDGNNLVILKPIAPIQEKRWDYSLDFWSVNKLPTYSFKRDFELTEKQAWAIKDAIESLMECIFTDIEQPEAWIKINGRTTKARNLIQKDNIS